MVKTNDKQDKQDTVVSKSAQIVKDATDAYVKALGELNTVPQEATDAQTAEDKANEDYMSWIDGVIQTYNDNRKAQEQYNVEQAKADVSRQQFAGLAEAAAALINVIGTTQGASPQVWHSPMDEFAARAAGAQRERDATLDKLDNQLQSLQDQRMRLNAAIAQRKSARQEQLWQRQDNIKQAQATALYKGALAGAEAQKAVDVANINAQSSETIAQIQGSSRQAVANTQAQSRQAVATTQADARRDVAETNAKARVDVANAKNGNGAISNGNGNTSSPQYTPNYNGMLYGGSPANQPSNYVEMTPEQVTEESRKKNNDKPKSVTSIYDSL